MNIFLSVLFLAALVGLIAWVKSRGWFQHMGCTCRKAGSEDTCEHTKRGQ